MKPITRDADGRVDVSISFWWGVFWLSLILLMWTQSIGDMGLYIFFGLTGLVPMVLGWALTPRRP